jgi:MSHA biogenesis protein MshO
MRAVQLILHKGFTLIELVIVIIILSVLGIATSSYIASGVDIYSDISARDKSLNSIRFVMERLRREVSSALPNSAYLDSNACLVFTPIVASSIYVDLPIIPISADSAVISPMHDYELTEGDQAVVYLLSSSELPSKNEFILGSDKVHQITGLTGTEMSFNGDVSFALDSPAKRIYIIRDDTSYCFLSNNLYRRVNESENILMAENVSGSFQVMDATLQRNSLVRSVFQLNFDGQEVAFEEALHINNVP